MRYFLDTYALIEIARGNKNFDRYLDKDCVTLNENIAELYYSELLDRSRDDALFIVKSLSKMVVNLHPETIEKAMEFRHQNKKKKFSYIDCFGYIFSLENNRLFLTGDIAFKDMGGVEFVK